MDPTTQFLMMIMSLLQSLPIAQSASNAVSGQQQAMQRQLSASDLMKDPNKVMARINAMLGLPSDAHSVAGSPGNPGLLGQLQALQSKLTPQIQSGTLGAIKQNIAPQLQASGMTQAPGIQAEEFATALGPQALQEQELGAQLAEGEQQGATNLSSNSLEYPFKLGSGIAGQFPLAGAFV